MRLEHNDPPDVHPWDLHDVGVPPHKPFPPIIPLLIEHQYALDAKVDKALPPNAIHNGFVPQEQWTPVRIVQPDPQHGNKMGRR